MWTVLIGLFNFMFIRKRAKKMYFVKLNLNMAYPDMIYRKANEKQNKTIRMKYTKLSLSLNWENV